MANEEKKNFIIVKDSGVTTWAIESLFDAAVEDGLQVEEYTSRDDVKKYFSDEEDIPEGYLDEAEKIGYPCVHVFCWHNGLDFWVRQEKFDREYEARKFLMSDCKDIIPIENIEDAEKIATSYSGDCKYKVRDAAWRILAENGKWEDAKKREIENLVENEEISAEFSEDGNAAKVTYLGDFSKFEKDEFGEWGEWFGKILHLLDIEGDDDMTNYLFECLEKKDANNEKK